MKKIPIELSEENSEFLHELAVEKNVTPSEIVEDLLKEKLVIAEFGSVENFDKFIQQGIDGGFVEADEEFWKRLKEKILQKNGL